MPSSENARWHAVRALPRVEEHAQVNLTKQAFDVFTPRLSRSVRYARRQSCRLKPLFSECTFIRLDASRQSRRPVDSTFGVASIVKIGHTQAPLQPGLVEQIKALTDGNGELRGQTERMVVGDRVRVVGGPFDTWFRDVLSLPDMDCILQLINTMTREIKLNMAAKAAVLVERARHRKAQEGRTVTAAVL